MPRVIEMESPDPTALVPQYASWKEVKKQQQPELYRQAVAALAECDRIDQVKDTADKMEAMRIYAFQANDDTLYHTAVRIKARAVRRLGEILKEFDGRGGDRKSSKIKKAATGPFDRRGRRREAKEAGVSERQQKTATRIASIPKEDFERAVEAKEPATVTQLAAWREKPKNRPQEAEAKPAAKVAKTQVQEMLDETFGLYIKAVSVDASDAIKQHKLYGVSDDEALHRKWLRDIDEGIKKLRELRGLLSDRLDILEAQAEGRKR